MTQSDFRIVTSWVNSWLMSHSPTGYSDLVGPHPTLFDDEQGWTKTYKVEQGRTRSNRVEQSRPHVWRGDLHLYQQNHQQMFRTTLLLSTGVQRRQHLHACCNWQAEQVFKSGESERYISTAQQQNGSIQPCSSPQRGPPHNSRFPHEF